MPTYRFYQIISDKGPSCYIGSTRQTPERRFSDHITAYRRGGKSCSVKTIFDLYGVENCRLIVIEEIECETKDKALQRERHYQSIHREHSVNMRRAYITHEESKEYYATHQRTYLKTYLSRKEQSLSPDEFQAFMEKRRLHNVEAQRRYRQRLAEAKPSSE